MTEQVAKVQLPPIPAKRYFTIGEVSELCGVKPHVLRYWEQEFTQLKPVKRRGNRRYYQHHEVLLIRRIRELLYEQGFTISGARNRLDDLEFNAKTGHGEKPASVRSAAPAELESAVVVAGDKSTAFDYQAVKAELREILNLLRTDFSLANTAH
ncbi:MerR family transcriptional regulator [Methylotenera sp.]|uniref:MerR family transcriptional regulator n=1 Tax=Methylotenera sp. TaxID=2051956 RepID=UPI002ED8E0C2